MLLEPSGGGDAGAPAPQAPRPRSKPAGAGRPVEPLRCGRFARWLRAGSSSGCIARRFPRNPQGARRTILRPSRLLMVTRWRVMPRKQV
jgi:hypothetical protein